MVNIGEWLQSNIFFVLFTSFVSLGSLWLSTLTDSGKLVKDRILIRLPIFGKIIKDNILSKFSKTFGILVNAGVPIIDTLNLVKKVVDNRVFEEAVLDASKDIREGYNISTALKRTEVFPSIMIQLTTTGEETGELDDLLDRAADYYYKQVNVLVDRMTTLIEPMLILAVGVVIAIMVVITYLPVFHLGAALQSGL